MKSILKYASFFLLASGLGLCLHSCEDTYPSAADSAYPVDMKALRILNAGADGNTVFDGTIDEANKIVNFKRIDPATDFSALKLEATLPEGAVLEKDVLDFSMLEGESEKTLLLRVKNHARYKDYFVRVRQKVPVFGADWEKATVYNFSGDNIYEECTSSSTRWADCDGEYVLVVSRVGGLNPHLLRVSDLKQGKIEQIKLSTNGISGGTFAVSTGALRNGHIYINNMSAGVFKIYYYDTPASDPEVILEYNFAGLSGLAGRHGDNCSYNIDEKGNGFLFFASNPEKVVDGEPRDFVRFTIANHKEISNPQVLATYTGANSYPTINSIKGTEQYVFSGAYTYPRIVNASNGAPVELKSLNGLQITAATILTFNEERYLLGCSAARSNAVTPTMYLFNLTRGKDLAEAVAIFEAGDHNPLYQFVLGGTNNGNPASSVNYFIEKDAEGKDAVLRVFAFRTQSGFAMAEFPIKVATDD